MTKTAKDFEKLAAEAAAAGKDNVEALLESGTVLLKGTEEIVKAQIAFAQETAHKNAEGVQALLASKTLNELTETQSQLARQSLDGFIAQATKLSELSVKLAKDSFDPINTQLNKSLKKAGSAA